MMKKANKKSKYPDIPITQKEWLQGYWRWRKQKEKHGKQRIH